MKGDKFKAVWVSHSSIRDFLICPRLYYFRNVYRDPKTGHKITRIQPSLTLGQVVHDVVESLSVVPVESRLKINLPEKFDKAWEEVKGKRGGFTTQEKESEMYDKGMLMIKKIMKNPGPIARKAVKIPQELPYYWLSQEEEIILSGKIDWLEYLPDSDSLNVIDFKTGKTREEEGSLQLPIYYLLVTNTQGRKVGKLSYWYLLQEDAPVEMTIPDMEKAREDILEIAKRMKLARKLEHFTCPLGEGGCRHCVPLEMIAKGKGELVGISNYNQDIYILH